MDDSPAPPLSLKERIAQLQQAAHSPLASPSPSSSSTLGPTSSSSTAPSPPHRAPSPQVLARYIQSATGNTPLKADPAQTSTSALTARGERPLSPTTSRTSPSQHRTRPSFAQPTSRPPQSTDPPLRDAESALSATLAASPARSGAGSTASLADPQPRPRPPPPPRPAFAAAKRAAPAPAAAPSPGPPLPTRSSTLSSSSSAAPAPAPLLPPRRASTLSVHLPTTAAAGSSAGGSAPSPPLPPRPRAATAAGAAPGPQRAVPPRPQGSSSDYASRASTTTAAAARPALVPKPTTHDPLSAATARAKPYAASSRLGSSSAAASRTSLVSTASSASSSPGTGSASPAWLVPNKPATPLSALAVRPVDARARRRYEDVFARLVEGDEDEVEGQVVAGLWRRSGLPEGELRRIWEEVASGETALDGEAFVKGMWAIDEALRVRRERSGVRV
ncbi:hypothetical protein JCM8208_001785 [Rhodotorula glutinis]